VGNVNFEMSLERLHFHVERGHLLSNHEVEYLLDAVQLNAILKRLRHFGTQFFCRDISSPDVIEFANDLILL